MNAPFFGASRSRVLEPGFYKVKLFLYRHEDQLAFQVGKNEEILNGIKDTKSDVILLREKIVGIQETVEDHSAKQKSGSFG